MAKNIIITNKDGNIKFVNKFALDYYKYELSELLNNTPRIFKSGLNSPVVYDELWDTITKGKIWKGRLINKNKNRDMLVEDIEIMPIIVDNEIIGYLSVKSDATIDIEEEKRIFYDVFGLNDNEEFIFVHDKDHIKINIDTNLKINEIRCNLLKFIPLRQLLYFNN